jgi:hypothetical protein
MMKKLMILMLVLGMASWANAAIVSFDAQDGLPGDTITITVSSDEQVSGVILAMITDNGFGGTANPGAWDAKFTTSDAGYNGGGYGFGAGDLVLATGAVDLPHYATGDLYTYSYDIPLTAVVGSTITFTVEDIADYGYLSSIQYVVEETLTDMSITGMEFTANVIPEPMTMALLGLGGLFLRRRKK